MLSQYTSVISRVMFVGAFVVAGLAVWEKVTNLFGFTLSFMGGYAPSRLLEWSAVILLFVIALQLRELKQAQRSDTAS